MSADATPNENGTLHRIKLDKAGVTLPGIGRWGGRWVRLQNIMEMRIFMTPAESPHDHTCELCLFVRQPMKALNGLQEVETISYDYFPDAQEDLDAIAAAIAKL